ncbi:MAG: hypothetical protein IKO96_03370 [Spirochaetales bacterium]|nr:hypothetical protein [Spirochaetales bacterium]
MTKRIILLGLILICAVLLPVFAADQWYYNKEIAEFSFSGLKNVSESAIGDALYVYRNKPFTDELFARLQNDLYAVDGIDFFTADAEQTDAGDLRIVFEFYEVPMVSAVKFEGNSAVKVRDLREAVTSVTAGMFGEPGRKAVFDAAIEQISTLYNSKGYIDVPVTYTIEEDAETNSYTVTFNITEGNQVRLTQILFTGNENIDSTILKKQVSSRVKSLFNNGYLKFCIFSRT